MFQLFEARYNANMVDKKWSKTRRYIYHATTISSRKQLTMEQVVYVLDYLEDIFSDNQYEYTIVKKSLTTKVEVQYILQNIPRVLKKDVETNIKPTITFLKRLYKDHLFFEAVGRNPNLLLTTGVLKLLPEKKNKSKKNQEAIQHLHDDVYIKDEDTALQMDAIESHLISELQISQTVMKRMKQTQLNCFQKSSEEQIKSIVKYLLSCLDVVVGYDNNSSLEKNEQQRRQIIGKVIASNPKILSLNLQTNLIPKVQFLQQECGFINSHDLMVLWKKCPYILGLSLQQNLIPTINLIKETLCLSRGDIWYFHHCQMLDGSHLSSSSSISPSSIHISATTFTNTTSMATIQKILLKHPQLLGLSQDNLFSKIEYFHQIDKLLYMDMIDDDTFNVARIFDKHDNKPFDNNRLAATSSLASKILMNSPSVYSLSLKQNIIPTIECLAKLWGVKTPYSNSKKQSNPQHVNHRKNKDKKHLSLQLSDYTLILTLSLEGNIQPTINFYNRTGYICLDESYHSIHGNESTNRDSHCDHAVYLPGRYLATSLFQRLLPRWNYHLVEESKRCNELEAQKSQKSNISYSTLSSDDSDTNNSVPFKRPPLHLIASSTDERFCEQMEYDLFSYVKFKDEAVPRLKFSSQFDTWLKTGKPIDL